MKVLRCFFLSAVLVLIASNVTFAASSYTDTWDVSGDLAGWSPRTVGSTVNVVDTGGNPDGYLLAAGSGSSGISTTKSEFTGNYSAAGANNISLDMMYFSGNFVDASLVLRYESSASNGWAYDLADVFPLNQWVSYSVDFDTSWTDEEAMATGWYQTDPSVSFTQLMTNVYQVQIDAGLSTFGEAGYDNVSITVVPEPVSTTLFLIGGATLGFRRLRKRVS